MLQKLMGILDFDATVMIITDIFGLPQRGLAGVTLLKYFAGVEASI